MIRSSSREGGSEPDQPTRTFEVGLDGDVADLVRRATPIATVVSVPTCTVLWSHIRSTDELDDLLDALLSLGITPHELYESSGTVRSRPGLLGSRQLLWPARRPPVSALGSAYCEVRIDGRLGDTLLRSLRWSSRVAQITVIRLRVSSALLCSTLAGLGATTRIDYVVAI